MHSPSTAVLWEVWKRHQWTLIANAVWLVAIGSLCHALSDGMIFGVHLFAGKHAILFLLLLAISPILSGLLPLFAYGCDADNAKG